VALQHSNLFVSSPCADGNRTHFENFVVFILKTKMMDRVQILA
jgi:hypothetical protein